MLAAYTVTSRTKFFVKYRFRNYKSTLKKEEKKHHDQIRKLRYDHSRWKSKLKNLSFSKYKY